MSIDYSEKMPDLVFTYDDLHVPGKLPDPQIDPIIPGDRVPLKKVGIAPVDLPVKLLRRNGGTQELQTKASLYCSLDDPNAKGLNLSRLYLLMHEKIKDKLSLDGIKEALSELAEKQGSKESRFDISMIKFYCANILKRVIDTGEYKPAKVKTSVTPSMDIQVASNFERLLFYIVGQDDQKVSLLMDHLSKKGFFPKGSKILMHI